MEKLKLAIADGQPVYLKGLYATLRENNIQVSIVASNGKELMRQMEIEEVDIILLDMHLPYQNGLECLNEIQEKHPFVKIIITSIFNDPETIRKCISLGASYYLSKDKATDEIIDTIHSVSLTENSFMKQLFDLLRENYSNDCFIRNLFFNTGVKLTVKEIKIIQMICLEMTSEDIALQLNHSKRSIESYRNNIIRKIGCRNVAGIIVFAVKNRLVYC